MVKLTMIFKYHQWKSHIGDMKIQQFPNPALYKKKPLQGKMQAWQIHAYGGIEQVQLTNARIPIITKPTEVLIQVKAASVNYIDVAMTKGYGAEALNLVRKLKTFSNSIEFPLTMGRDFCGIVVCRGHGVDTRLNIGDEVWGVIPVDQQGCHANYVVVESDLVNIKPANLSYIEAASILYAGLTAWSALWLTGGLYYKSLIPRYSHNSRLLILGGSGGVGTLAIQLAKAWKMKVVTTCKSDAISTLQKLGADRVINYTESNADEQIIDQGPYDMILDCCDLGPKYIQVNRYPYNTYITLNSPLLRNIDQYGLLRGNAKNLSDFIKSNIPVNGTYRCVKWGFFVPSRTGINFIQKLVESKQIVPVIDQIYSFDDLPKAYEHASKRHSRGKLVIDMKSCYNEQ